ncbi:response regulator [Pseudomonas alloputida]|uniref:response regulator n=1 Tax=Pseudomonas alloputida TaxID=1940621 RepID=UPI003865CBCE
MDGFFGHAHLASFLMNDLPAVAAPSAASPAAVLLIEDEPALRELITFMLEELGATVTAVATADEGIALLEQQPTWAIVMTDVRTPGTASGLQLAALARPRLPRAGIIVTSGYHSAINDTLPQGISFLPKPWSVEALLALVRPHLNPEADRRPAA